MKMIFLDVVYPGETFRDPSDVSPLVLPKNGNTDLILLIVCAVILLAAIAFTVILLRKKKAAKRTETEKPGSEEALPENDPEEKEK